MTSVTHLHTIPAPAAPASGVPTSTTRQPLRLRLKPKAPATGYVDGGWWPRSRDLLAELPELARVLSVRLGSVRRVTFALSGWDTTTRRTEVDGRPVRLEGFRSQDANIVHITGSNRQRLSLLVVPPDATDSAAHDALMTAAGPDNADTPEQILTSSGVTSAGPRCAPSPRA